MTTFDVVKSGFAVSKVTVARGTPAALQMASQRLVNCELVVA
jgi:hypothetical protein